MKKLDGNIIQVGILDDHQGIIDGYRYRLDKENGIDIIAAASYGEDLDMMLEKNAIDVLLLDVYVPISRSNDSPYPILHTIPRLFERYPEITVIVISVVNRPAMIRAVLDAGASGYILKDDHQALLDLGAIIRTVANDGVFMSRDAHKSYSRNVPEEIALSPRQREALSLCAAFPNMKTAELANRLGVAHSTFRNLLSHAYLRLDVSNRTGAIIRAQQLGVISQINPE
jgi:DNA-binding NarL/FixJ family response regulator